MTKRMKWFLGVLVAAVIVASVAGGGNGAGLVKLLMMLLVLWLIWRGFVFFMQLMKPVRDKVRPQVDAFNSHVDDTLRRSGFSSVADASKKVQAGIDGAVDETQRGIEERNK